MYRLLPISASLVLLCIFITSCKPTSEKKTFELKLVEGKQMNSTVSMDANASIRAIGDVELDLTVTADLEYLPGKIKENQTPLTLTLNNMDGNFHMHQGFIQSADIPSDQDFDFSEVTDKYEGKPVTILMNKQAQVTGIVDLDKIIGQEAVDSIKSLTTSAEVMLGENFFERLIAFTAVLPDEPVAIGDNWNQEISQEIFGLPVNLQATYTYKSSDNGIARFNVDANFEMDTVDFNDMNFEFPIQGIPISGQNIRVLLRGNQTGYIDVNETTGWSTESDLLQKFKIEFRFGLVTVPAEITNTIKISPSN